MPPLQSVSPKNLSVHLNHAAGSVDHPSSNHLNAASNSCGSSTISTSMTISSSTAAPVPDAKKKLNASTADAIKAKAAISALDMPPNIDTMDSPELSSRSSLSPASPVRQAISKQQSAPAKSPVNASTNGKKDAMRMIDTDIDDIDDNDVSERCLFNTTTTDTSYSVSQQAPPPSFDSALQAKQQQQQSVKLANNVNHQYQNVL